MRAHGTRFELVGMRPHDHIGWVFAGPAEFSDLASGFLAEGAALGELLMFVADEPSRHALAGLDRFTESGALRVVSTADVYGASGVVDAARQRATFAEALAEALAEGYPGIRVAADNTSLVSSAERFDAWLRWENAADRFMSENPVTGLCAFDRDRVDVDRLRHVTMLHPLSSADSPIPQYRLFADGQALVVEGDIDSSAVDELDRALRSLPPATGVVIDLATATLLSGRVLAALAGLAEAGVDVTIRGAPAVIARYRAISGPPGDRLSLVDA
jgi:hypothetical protein